METNLTSQAFPIAWTKEIHKRLRALYGKRFDELYDGIVREDLELAWTEGLLGITPEQIKTALTLCKTKPHPPTLPDFLLMCQGAVSHDAEWRHACEQMRVRLEGTGQDCWHSPRQYWAAIKIGAYDLMSATWPQIQSRWIDAYTSAGNDPIPAHTKALPAPEMTPERMAKNRERVQELVATVGGGEFRNEKGEPYWALKIFERYARGEQVAFIAIKSAEEVLGRKAPEPAKRRIED